MSTQDAIRDARISYEKDTLDERDVARDPLVQFKAWLETALASDAVVEPNAVTVATVGSGDRPSLRVVLLRGYDERGFVFFTNYESRKGHELAAHSAAAMLFYWAALERQVRIEGAVARLTPDESDAYFMKRPRGHRLSAWASKQSSVVPSRAYLEEQMAQEDVRFKDVEVGRPPYWGGYRLTPRAYEFWQGRKDRVHDRVVYERNDTGWQTSRLAP